MKQIPRTVFLVASLFLLLIGFSSCDVEQKKFSVTYESVHGNVPDSIEAEIIEESSFNMVDGFYKTGENIRVTAQVKPGLIYRLKGEDQNV